jgi:hypothetical protein
MTLQALPPLDDRNYTSHSNSHLHPLLYKPEKESLSTLGPPRALPKLYMLSHIYIFWPGSWLVLWSSMTGVG